MPKRDLERLILEAVASEEFDANNMDKQFDGFSNDERDECTRKLIDNGYLEGRDFGILAGDGRDVRPTFITPSGRMYLKELQA